MKHLVDDAGPGSCVVVFVQQHRISVRFAPLSERPHTTISAGERTRTSTHYDNPFDTNMLTLPQKCGTKLVARSLPASIE